MIYEFKITLKDVGVPVWRKIQMDSSGTFQDLHEVIQATFDWMDGHLHSFFLKKSKGRDMDRLEIVQEPDPDNDLFDDIMEQENRLEETDVKLVDFFVMKNDKASYVYDFGDNWDHDVVLTKIMSRQQGVTYPRCVGAKNIAPPEDSRHELIMGNIDLVVDHAENLVLDVNLDMEVLLEDMIEKDKKTKTAVSSNWSDILDAAKDLQKLKPWKFMNDTHVFMVEDPLTRERLFCSILGEGEEIYGMAVYIGEDGYRSLMDTLGGEKSNRYIMNHQQGLLLSFENREDLTAEEYAVIKGNYRSFHGKKAWPTFTSHKPGFLPWTLDEQERKWMELALVQALHVCQEIADGLDVPDLYEEQSVLARIPGKRRPYVFKNNIVDLQDYAKNEVTLDVSELELRRVEKQKLIATIEFSMRFIELPIQEDESERPILPYLIIAADKNEGLVVYHSMLTGKQDVGTVQREFLKFIEHINGIPMNLIMDEDTESLLRPVIEKLNVKVKVEDSLEIIEDVIDGFFNN